jgi:AcrR family transcriptional regulator
MASGDQATRKRILDHAAALFAERGFERVTVREICHDAGANVAAVNYHFGDKQSLYVAVVKMAIEIMRETNVSCRSRRTWRIARRSARAYVRVFLTRLMSTGRNSWIHQLMTHELESPSDAFDLVIHEVIEPRQKYLSAIIGAISGLPADDPRVILAGVSLQAQCLLFARPLPRKAPAAWRHVLDDAESIIAHVAEFSIAGMRSLTAATSRAGANTSRTRAGRLDQRETERRDRADRRSDRRSSAARPRVRIHGKR